MITPESIDFSLLPSLCLTRRSELPEVPAIYFAIASSTISKISSTSASDELDFLRLVFNWLYRSAASGKSLLAVADFCFSSASSDSNCLICSP
jgi:hypothetical protein